MDDTHLERLRELAAAFRDAIEVARAERAPGALPYFPDGACRMTSRLFARHLAHLPESAVFGPAQLVSGVFRGTEPPVRHHWLEVGRAVVDLTADPFGEAPVVVGLRTEFHHSLTALVTEDAADALSALTPDETSRLERQLAEIESRLRGSAR